MSSATTMHAIVFHAHGVELDRYQYVDHRPRPVCGADEVLIQVHYAALNRLDDWVRIGWPGIDLPLPHVPGSDFSGVIVACGADVSGWQVGQRVTGNNALWCGRCAACHQGKHNLCVHFGILGESRTGVMAEYLALPARNLIAIPDNYGMIPAAAASLTYLTAWHSLIERGQLQPGEKVLVVGAGGGVNVAAQQIARYRGAEVYVIASTAVKGRRALDMGAVWALDRRAYPDWRRAVFEATGRTGIDMVVDNVGAATFSTSLQTLAKGGRLVTVGATAGYEASIPVNRLFMGHHAILGSTMGTQADYNRVMELVFARQLAPVVDSVYPAHQYVEAVERLQANLPFGKIVMDLRTWPGAAS